MAPEEPPPGEPEEEPVISWSEVYRVGACGDCNRTDCPRCVTKFLKHLNHQGVKPQGPLE